MRFLTTFIINKERVFTHKIRHAKYKYRISSKSDYGLYSNTSKVEKSDWMLFKQVCDRYNRTVDMNMVMKSINKDLRQKEK
tara:strand:+ start:6434 stop:6676 length:243 start_codon:yes stop_codon:yes gene_type:complete